MTSQDHRSNQAYLDYCWQFEPVLENWNRLGKSEIRTLEERFLGKTLDEIANDESITREAIRIREAKAIQKLNLDIPCVHEVLDSVFALCKFACLNDFPRLEALPNGLKYSLAKFGNLRLHFYETGAVIAPKNLSESGYFRREMPISILEMESIGWPTTRTEALSYLEDSMGCLYIEGLGLVRKKASKRDEAVLRLRAAGAPIGVGNLCTSLGLDVRNVKAQLDRDSRFVRNFATDEVMLREWSDTEQPVKSATEAVARVLEKEGPQTQADLIAKATLLFPRSRSRYYQVITRKEFGLNSDNLIDLASRGATAAPVNEPEASDQVREYGDSRLAFNLTVGTDLLRGAGNPIPRRAAWLVGIRRPGDKVSLRLDTANSLEIVGYPGNTSLPSLRVFAKKMGLDIGCELEVAIDSAAKRIGLRGACPCHFKIQAKE